MNERKKVVITCGTFRSLYWHICRIGQWPKFWFRGQTELAKADPSFLLPNRLLKNKSRYKCIVLSCCATKRGIVKFHFQAIISFVTDSCGLLSSSTISAGTSCIAKWLENSTEKKANFKWPKTIKNPKIDSCQFSLILGFFLTW